eukprot:m.130742 g.130742  ORF g.130742 m.130742 type:complete len:217 (-) comp16801_c0_seq3:112-762(-)
MHAILARTRTLLITAEPHVYGTASDGGMSYFGPYGSSDREVVFSFAPMLVPDATAGAAVGTVRGAINERCVEASFRFFTANTWDSGHCADPKDHVTADLVVEPAPLPSTAANAQPSFTYYRSILDAACSQVAPETCENDYFGPGWTTYYGATAPQSSRPEDRCYRDTVLRLPLGTGVTTPAANMSIALRFTTGLDESLSNEGWLVRDDIAISIVPC